MEEKERDDSLEGRARRRVQARFGLVIHLALFVFANVALYVIWRATGRGYPWFLWPLAGWGIGIIGHVVALLIGPDSSFEERAVRREMGRLAHDGSA